MGSTKKDKTKKDNRKAKTKDNKEMTIDKIEKEDKKVFLTRLGKKVCGERFELPKVY
jgi:hypothetical protein